MQDVRRTRIVKVFFSNLIPINGISKLTKLFFALKPQKIISYLLSCLAVLLIFGTASALAASSRMEQLANMKGKEREQLLIEGAKKEGALSVYSAINARDAKPLVELFNKKYPFIKVDPFPGIRVEDMISRLILEQKAGKFTADAFSSPTIGIEKVRREGLLIPYATPAQNVFNKKHLDPQKYWVPMYHNILTFVYNTKEVTEPPQTWQDLLEPRWKGKLALEDTDEVWLINFIKLWGEAKAKDYFTRLGKQDLRIVHGHSVMQQMLIAGDVAASPTQYLHHAITDKKKGAPINFVLMDPMIDGPEGLTLLKNATHPHAALLFIDFATSREVQAFFLKRGRIPAYPGIDPLLQDANLLIDDPTMSLDNFAQHQKLFRDLLIAPNRRR